MYCIYLFTLINTIVLICSDFLSGSEVKQPPTNSGNGRDMGSIPGWEDPLGKEVATHSSILAWEIP